ncbi:hypothetical protein EB796_018142 [Bugula neritina]|uniref:Uncharacterized protein n=1 Tax=Bugula neritina TaxID=10212 RepID=A0A7J7JBU0_BUGNE|nr:hypothetical protein EB796_018142 [Bugula neritina]
MWSTNNQLNSKLQRQKHSNDDVLNKVATTREMCFALAGEHKRLKDRLEVGKSFLVDTQQKSSQQTLAVKKTMTSVEQFKDSIEQRLRQIEKMAKSKKLEQEAIIEELTSKEKLLRKEAELTAAIDELVASKASELSEAQHKLDEAVAASKNRRVTKECNTKSRETTLDCQSDAEIANLNKTLEQTSLNANADQGVLQQSIAQLNSELNSQRQAYSEKVEKLEEEIQAAKSNVDVLAKKLLDEQTHSAREYFKS